MNVRARWSGPLIWHFRAFKVKRHFLPSSVIIHLSACLYVGVSVLQVCRCEVTNQLRAGAGKKKKKTPNLQPLQQETLYICLSSPPAELLFSPFPLLFLIKTFLISLVQPEEAWHAGDEVTGWVCSVQFQICIVSTVHNLHHYLYIRLNSPQWVDPTSPAAAATSCVYITHHLLHPPIRRQSREADLEST